jgi:hypothetical protein
MANDACRKPMPRNSTPKPVSAVPMAARRVSAPVRRRAMPRPTKGRAAASTWILKPTRATSQPVMVVPMLAPNSTHSDCEKVSRPALTKPMAATVTALEDCTAAVTITPEARPRRRVWVEEVRTRPSAGPAACLRPSVISSMPSRNSPRPPSRLPMPMPSIMRAPHSLPSSP